MFISSTESTLRKAEMSSCLLGLGRWEVVASPEGTFVDALGGMSALARRERLESEPLQPARASTEKAGLLPRDAGLLVR